MKTIVIYPGSFSPIHIGHLNIIEKAERVFGKGSVILAIGINPDKPIPLDMVESAKEISTRIGRKVIVYSKFLHELVQDMEDIDVNVVILRGLRNGVDLDYEVNQFRFVQDFKSDINVIYMTCDKDFEHISSSAIRKIKQFNPELATRYIV